MNCLTALIFALAACAMVSSLTVKLQVTQDVTLERGSTNFNNLQYLIVGTHPNYPLKRSLIRFHPLQVRACDRVASATMYLYYAYAHKASFMSEAQVPKFPRTIVAHQVLKPWVESQATSTRRYYGANWAQPWLGFGTDAVAAPTSSGVTINPDYRQPGYTPSGFVGIDVTSAVRNWKNGQPNYGLLIRATNEYRQGRDFRFFSNADRDTSRHAYISVTCHTLIDNGGDVGVLRPVGSGPVPI